MCCTHEGVMHKNISTKVYRRDRRRKQNLSVTLPCQGMEPSMLGLEVRRCTTELRVPPVIKANGKCPVWQASRMLITGGLPLWEKMLTVRHRQLEAQFSSVQFSSVQVSSRWYLCAREGPCSLHPVSQEFPQCCP